MAQRLHNDPAGLCVGYPIIGYTSVQFSIADPVYVNTSGYLALATTSSKIIGYSLENITMSATNISSEKICPKYVSAKHTLVSYPMVSNTAVTQTQVGEYAILSSVTTNAISLNTTTSSTVGQFIIVGFDPNQKGDTYQAVVKAALRQPQVISST